MAQQGSTAITDSITQLINKSIMQAYPRKRWRRSIQIIIDKGKGKYIEHLRIIQLCEADLTFLLRYLWGK
jgi:hypothetical protein